MKENHEKTGLAAFILALLGAFTFGITVIPALICALILGKHLSPRLYINYSIGLFDSASVFRLRYQLTRHWSVEAQSGTATGGDILYSIER